MDIWDHPWRSLIVPQRIRILNLSTATSSQKQTHCSSAKVLGNAACVISLLVSVFCHQMAILSSKSNTITRKLFIFYITESDYNFNFTARI